MAKSYFLISKPSIKTVVCVCDRHSSPFSPEYIFSAISPIYFTAHPCCLFHDVHDYQSSNKWDMHIHLVKQIAGYSSVSFMTNIFHADLIITVVETSFAPQKKGEIIRF